jgi:hypothetical protein
VAQAAVTRGFRALMVTTPVAIRIRAVTAQAAPESDAASFTVRRLEMNAVPRPNGRVKRSSSVALR